MHNRSRQEKVGRHRSVMSLVVLGTAALVAACAGRSSESLQEARSAVAAARADQQVVTYALAPLQDSERALDQAESAFSGGADQDQIDHLAYVAEQRAAIAEAIATERVALAEVEELGEGRETLMLDARDRQIGMLERELAELQAERTDRGLVVTLSDDLLFDVDQADLKPGAAQQLARVSDFLRNHPDRNILIEGHTDSTASDSYNLALSQRRANAVEDFLISQGGDPTRISARGYGEQLPVATNDTAAGRQQNRRVELVILDPGAGIPAPRIAGQ
jgi:outer membrane protein OmpA-like peptidoglycan-associated protein